MTDTEKLVKATLAGKLYYRPEMGPVLVRVLDQNCVSYEHRKRVCDKAIGMFFGLEGRAEDRCPGPAELADLCREVDPVGKRKEASPDCQFCHGEGWEVGDGAKRCRCGGWPMSAETRARLNGSPVFGAKTSRGGVVSNDPEMQSLVNGIAKEKAL